MAQGQLAEASRHERLELDTCRLLMDELKTDGAILIAAHEAYLAVDSELQKAVEKHQSCVAEEDERCDICLGVPLNSYTNSRQTDFTTKYLVVLEEDEWCEATTR